MPVLDVRTIERVAELVCDIGGFNERSVRRLQRFLEGAGWDAPYQGPQGRVPWLVKTINGRNDDAEAISSLLRRVVDPREYDGGLTEAETFVERMNEVLAVDGFEVGLDRGRPFVRRTDDGDARPSIEQVAAALASPELRATVRSLVSDQELADILSSRLDEVEAARNAGAFVLAIVGTGSLIEGLLDDVMRRRDPEIRKRESTSLDLLLKSAHKRGWIQPDAFEFSDIVRQYRNFVHPREQQKRAVPPTLTPSSCAGSRYSPSSTICTNACRGRDDHCGQGSSNAGVDSSGQLYVSAPDLKPHRLDQGKLTTPRSWDRSNRRSGS